MCSWNVFPRGYTRRGGVLWLLFLGDWSSCFFVFTLFQPNFRKNLVSSAFPLELSASPSQETIWFLAHLFPVFCLSERRKSDYLAGE